MTDLITEQPDQQRELYLSEQRFRLLVQGVRDYAIYMLDPSGIITNWNSGAEAIKGYKAEEIVGQHFSRFYTQEDRTGGEPARALHTALTEGKYEKEAPRVRKDGSLFWASVLIDPIYDETGEHIGFAKVTRDITARKKAEDELEEARATLFQSQKMHALGELTGGIAHDFNNLMTVIRGSAELLSRPGLTEEKRKKYVEAILETADRAANLTDHLLAFGRRQPLQPEVIDLNIRMDAFGEMVSRTLGSTIEVVLELSPALWKVKADATQLETALLNAAINARDAMPGGGRLTISTANRAEQTGDMVCLTVADTGTGMPAEIINRAFEPFFTTKPVGKGTGLGLSQIHGFAAQTGGRAEIESVEGIGTTIRLLLPRTLEEVAAPAEEEGGATIPPGLIILLVEDNDQVREFATHLLEELHCRVVSATTGAEALVCLETQKVDFVVSDVVMPGISGVELARQVRQKFPELPILLASGYSQEIMGGEASDFSTIRKPYGAQSLGASIAGALAVRKGPTLPAG